jgi:hypothetical protein
MRFLGWVLLGWLVCGIAGGAQRAALPPVESQADAPPHRARLILKDGTYQMVTSYKVVGDRVRYVSAERGGATEEIPLKLVDLDATKKWEQQHLASLGREEEQQGPPVIDPELAREEADRAAITPEVAPDLRLPAEDSVLALDTWHGAPELVPLNQQQTDLNKQTGHGVLKGIVNPRSAAHQVAQLKGEKADVQLHVSDPVLYVRLDDAQVESGEALTVDTHGASAANSGNKITEPSEYAIVRMEVRQDARVVTSFQIGLLGQRKQEDVTETTVTVLPGGHWAKIVPKENLLFGEYALVEVLGEKEINLGVWDFGVHPTAPENRDVVLPEKKRPVELERRRP